MTDSAGSNRAVLGVLAQAQHTHRLRDIRQVAGQIGAAMDRHGVLTDATAIAFRMLFALAFLTLTGLAFAGAVHLEAIWKHQLGPNIAHMVSPNFYRELDHSVDQVLTTRRWWWLSIGLVLTLWQVSSGVRALMTSLDSIYEVKDRRPFWERMAISIGLAGMITACLFVIGGILLALWTGPSGPSLLRAALFVLRLVLSAGILIVMVSLLLRFTVPEHIEVRWLTFGSGIAIGIWLLSSWAFGWYVANLGYRGYQQAFGVLSLLIVVMTYLYIASVAFLVGAELDALLVTEAKVKRRR
jgi:YihY family inner membrane protein